MRQHREPTPTAKAHHHACSSALQHPKISNLGVCLGTIDPKILIFGYNFDPKISNLRIQKNRRYPKISNLRIQKNECTPRLVIFAYKIAACSETA